MNRIQTVELQEELDFLSKIIEENVWDIIGFEELYQTVLKHQNYILNAVEKNDKEVLEKCSHFIKLIQTLFIKKTADYIEQIQLSKFLWGQYFLLRLLHITRLTCYLQKQVEGLAFNQDLFAENRLAEKLLEVMSDNLTEGSNKDFLNFLDSNFEELLNKSIQNIGVEEIQTSLERFCSKEEEKIEDTIFYHFYKQMNSNTVGYYGLVISRAKGGMGSIPDWKVYKAILNGLNIDCVEDKKYYRTALKKEIQKRLKDKILTKTNFTNIAFLDVEALLLEQIVPKDADMSVQQFMAQRIKPLFFETLANTLSFKYFYRFIANEAKSLRQNNKKMSFKEHFYHNLNVFLDSFTKYKTKEEVKYKNASQVKIWKELFLLSLEKEISLINVLHALKYYNKEYQKVLKHIFRDNHFLSEAFDILESKDKNESLFNDLLATYNYNLFLQLIKEEKIVLSKFLLTNAFKDKTLFKHFLKKLTKFNFQKLKNIGVFDLLLYSDGDQREHQQYQLIVSAILKSFKKGLGVDFNIALELLSKIAKKVNFISSPTILLFKSLFDNMFKNFDLDSLSLEFLRANDYNKRKSVFNLIELYSFYRELFNINDNLKSLPKPITEKVSKLKNEILNSRYGR